MPKRIDISRVVTVAFRSLVAVGAGWMVAASLAGAECVTVTSGTNYEPSSVHVRIVTSREGKPLPGVKIDLETGEHRHLLITNAQGIILVAKLRPGKQCMVATAFDNATAQLCLDVSLKSKVKLSSFSIEMPPSPTLQGLVRAEGLSVMDHMKGFTGTVRDVTGAVVPSANIEILPKGSKDEDHAIRIQADASGHFSALLPDGTYVAFFQSPGFSTKTEVFEVGKKFEPKDLRISLTIGRC